MSVFPAWEGSQSGGHDMTGFQGCFSQSECLLLKNVLWWQQQQHDLLLLLPHTLSFIRGRKNHFIQLFIYYFLRIMPEASCTLGLCLSNTVFTTVPILAWGPSRDFISWWALYSHYCLLCSSYKWLQEKWMPSCLSLSHYKTVGVNPTFQLENCGDQLEKDNEDLKMSSCSFFFFY